MVDTSAAEPASVWTTRDLQANDVTVTTIAAVNFFGCELGDVPFNTLYSDFVEYARGQPLERLSDTSYRLLQYQKFAALPGEDQAAAILDFCRELLHTTGYEERGLLASAYLRRNQKLAARAVSLP